MVDVPETTNSRSSIEARLEIIEDNLQRLLTLMETNSTSCNKMDSHIDFVESIYQRLRYPFTQFLPLFVKTKKTTEFLLNKPECHARPRVPQLR
tara:strand:+ start:751 stop:1032 length:282 start_codon:yes stop_codon:yes gene_type:complete